MVPSTTVASLVGPHLGRLFTTDVSLVFWDGSQTPNAASARATVTIRSPDAFRRMLWTKAELGLARAFVAGEVEITGDKYLALAAISRNIVGTPIGVRSGLTLLRAAKELSLLAPPPPPPVEEVHFSRLGRHSKRHDAASISYHYDVSNEFYRLILGQSMTYSCARFVEPTDSLETAQAAKYDLICRKLGLQQGMRLLDVGCGWGGMVLHAVEHYGVDAVGVSISEAQVDLASKRVAEAGFGDRIEIRYQDYRDLPAGERFDAISSIGMFEHVGRIGMHKYFSVLARTLRPGGRLLNHAIDRHPEEAAAPSAFIQRYVFPEGELQELGTVITAIEQTGLEVTDVESLRRHYGRTLRRWVDNLEVNWDEAVRLVGANRARVWWLYMTGSAVAFEANRNGVHQVLAVKPYRSGDNKMPLTRERFL